MVENSPKSLIVTCGRVDAIEDDVRWVVRLSEQGFRSRFGWSIRGGVQSGKGGDGLKPCPWIGFPDTMALNFPKNIRRADTMVVTQLFLFENVWQ